MAETLHAMSPVPVERLYRGNVITNLACNFIDKFLLSAQTNANHSTDQERRRGSQETKDHLAQS